MWFRQFHFNEFVVLESNIAALECRIVEIESRIALMMEKAAALECRLMEMGNRWQVYMDQQALLERRLAALEREVYQC
jgi:hypothetical protein